MKTQQTPAELIAEAKRAIEDSRRAYVAQAVADSKECAVCGEAVTAEPCASEACVAWARTCRDCGGDTDFVGDLNAHRRCEECQAELEHDTWVDFQLDEMRDEGGRS